MALVRTRPPGLAPRGGVLVYRTRWPIRVWHWLNALSVFVLLMSGMMIFNAHPHLYWGAFGANFDRAWLEIGSGHVGTGQVRIGGVVLPGGGVFGRGPLEAFPYGLTIPSHFSLADARLWHFLFAWVFVVSGTLFMAWALLRGHVWRELLPRARELSPRHLLHDIADHARLRFPTGEKALQFNVLQKLAYCTVVLVLIPLMILTGLTMAPGMDAAWPWLLWLFHGRQSARSIHFIAATAIAGFIVVHLLMVVLAGPVNEMRSMVTGWYRLPRERRK